MNEVCHFMQKLYWC